MRERRLHVADALLGFRPTRPDGTFGDIVHGPPPPQARLSDICEAFGCTPSAARQEDPAEVDAIFEWRNAVQAVEWMEQGAAGAEQFAKHPHLLQLLQQLYLAQGMTVTDEALFAKMRQRDEEDED